ncbi:MAG TPA: murein biosynthesis integral membrane protein MurJ [Gammaproteobacteria bacterium]|nr:murein biosynthesis integral membrane protein MurJ [Gammaproteobacteria bacterium]
MTEEPRALEPSPPTIAGEQCSGRAETAASGRADEASSHAAPSASAPAGSPGRASSALVAAGILLSRIAGLVRERLLAVYFGAGLHADVFSAALRMPNALQNLLGEGTLSASFIPVYSELLHEGRREEAGRVAGAIFALLLCVAAAIALLGVGLAPLLVRVLAPGFEGQRRELTIAVVRIVFPMTGLLVLSAWALGILNSHRRFFLPYFAPVLWNASMIAALVVFGRRLSLDGLLTALAWGAFAGGALQFAVQLPSVFKLDREIRLNGGRGLAGVREAVRNAGPAILGRGVVQLSTYIDMILASLLAIGALARLRYAQTLYLLPISLFAMSVAAAALPELARRRGGVTAALREQTAAAVQRVAFYVVPSGVAFVLLGRVFVAGLYEAGQFGAADVEVVWFTLAAYSLGLFASAATRVYQSAFFALRDTKTPARAASVRVAVSSLAGALLMIQFEPITIGGATIPAGLFGAVQVAGLPLGPVGLALGAAAAAWTEWALLRGRLARRVGGVGIGAGVLAKMLIAALAAAAAGLAAASALESVPPLPSALTAAAAFGVVYFGVGRLLGLAEAKAWTAGLRRLALRKHR